MANFVTDYSNLNAAAGFLKGATESYQDSEDRRMKRMEMESKINTEADARQRNALLDKLSLQKAGYAQGDDGSLQEVPLTDRQQDEQTLSGMEKGIKTTFDPDTGRPTYQYDQSSPQAIGARAKFAAAGNANEFKGRAADDREDRMDRSEHEKVLGRVNSNPLIRQRLTQYQNLDNALSQMLNADHMSPQQFQEAQQAIRANLGIKGTSGIGERESSYLKSVGLNAESFKQFLTGDISDVNPNSEFVKHIKNLAALEQKNIRKQFDISLKAAAGGHASMYARRPDLREDLTDYLQGVGGQMQSQVGQPDQEAGGLLPKQQGLLGSQQGLLGGQQAAPAAPPHPQDAEALSVANQILANPKSTPEQKQKAQKVLDLNRKQ